MTTTKGSGYSNGRGARHGSAQLIDRACERTDACVVTDMNTMRLLFAVKKKQHDKDKGEIERESGGRKIGIDGRKKGKREGERERGRKEGKREGEREGERGEKGREGWNGRKRGKKKEGEGGKERKGEDRG